MVIVGQCDYNQLDYYTVMSVVSVSQLIYKKSVGQGEL